MASTLAFRCDVCSLSVNSQGQLAQHFSGSRHKRRAISHTQGTGQAIKRPLDYFIPAQSEVPVSQSQNSTQQGAAVPAASTDTFCYTCRVQLTSTAQAAVHYQGAKHRQTLKLLEEKNSNQEDEATAAKKAKVEICEVCNVKLLSPAVAVPHYSGEKHRRKVMLLKSIGLVNDGDETPQVNQPQQAGVPQQNKTSSTSQVKKIHCDFCNITLNSQAQMEAHRSGAKHRLNVEKCAGAQRQAVCNVTSNVSNSVPVTTFAPSNNTQVYNQFYQTVEFTAPGQCAPLF